MKKSKFNLASTDLRLVSRFSPYQENGELNCYAETHDAFVKGKYIPIRKKDWLVEGLIPMGEITVIAGDPDVGKTTLQATLAALVSNEHLYLPCGEEKQISADYCGKVLLAAYEDCIESTVMARAKAAKVDMENLMVWRLAKRPVPSMYDTKSLVQQPTFAEKIARHDQVALVLFDHIDLIYSGYPDTKQGRKQALLDMTWLAREKNFAVVANAHFGKNPTKTTSALDRIADGAIIGRTVRKVLYIEELFKGENNSKAREFCIFDAKSNISVKAMGLHYSIEGVDVSSEDGLIHTSKIRFHGYMEQEVIQELESRSRKVPKLRASRLEKAKAFLSEFLSAGPRRTQDLLEAAKEAGFSRSTLDRARSEIGVVAWKPTGKGPHCGFCCCLPDHEGLEFELDDRPHQVSQVPQVHQVNCAE